MKINLTTIKPLEGGFADRLVIATGKIANETREVKGNNDQVLHFLEIEVTDEKGFKTNIDILVQPDMEIITTAIQYRMSTKFYITFDSQYNRWVEKRTTYTATEAESNENAPW